MTNPVKADADNTEVTFEFKGDTYSVPPQSEWLVETLEFLEDGKITWVLRQLLGEDDWARFKSHKPKVPELGDLMTTLSEASGVQGN